MTSGSQTCVQPSVSVLLPAWNEAGTIGRCLESLLAIDWPELEIIVCAGGIDGTFELARAYEGPRVTVLEQRPGEGKQGALRRCFAESSGEIIYLTDADCIVPNDVFQQVINPIALSEARAVTGTSWPMRSQRTEPFVMYQWSIDRAVERGRSSTSYGMIGRNCAVIRDAVIAAGAFAEDVSIGTDYYLAKKLLARGETIRFVLAPVETEFPVHPGSFIRQHSRWQRNILLHGHRFNDTDEIRATVRTVIIGVGFLIWPLTWPWTRLAGIAMWLAFFGYLLYRRAGYTRDLVNETEDLTMRARYVVRLPAFTLLDMLAWASPVVDLTSRRRWRKW